MLLNVDSTSCFGSSLQGSPQRISCLHPTLPSASIYLTPFTFMFSLTSMNLVFGLPPGLLPGSLKLRIHHNQHPSTNVFNISPLDQSVPSQSGLSDFIYKVCSMCCPSDILIPDPIHPDHSHREPQHLYLCYLQLCLLSFLQWHCL